MPGGERVRVRPRTQSEQRRLGLGARPLRLGHARLQRGARLLALAHRRVVACCQARLQLSTCGEGRRLRLVRALALLLERGRPEI